MVSQLVSNVKQLARRSDYELDYTTDIAELQSIFALQSSFMQDI